MKTISLLPSHHEDSIMKKTALSLAVATTLTTPLIAHTDTVLYGEAKVSMDYIDNNRDDNAYWDVVNNG